MSEEKKPKIPPTPKVKASKKAGRKFAAERQKQLDKAAASEPIDWRIRYSEGVVVEFVQDPADRTGKTLEPANKIQSPLMRMHARGTISDTQFAAGQRLCQAYMTGVVGARLPTDDQPGGNVGANLSFGYAAARLIALQEYRTAKEALGPRLWCWVDWVVNKEIPVSDLAKKFDRNPQELMGVLKVAMECLDDFFCETDNRTRKEVKRA